MRLECAATSASTADVYTTTAAALFIAIMILVELMLLCVGVPSVRMLLRRATKSRKPVCLFVNLSDDLQDSTFFFSISIFSAFSLTRLHSRALAQQARVRYTAS